jgi:hypothetical protein
MIGSRYADGRVRLRFGQRPVYIGWPRTLVLKHNDAACLDFRLNL